MELSAQEIQSLQGTRNESLAPWMSYDAEMKSDLPPQLEKAVEEYAERRYDSHQTSSQNQEELARQREVNDELSEQYQWVKPEEYADTESRIGRVIHSSQLINRLRKIGDRNGITFHYRQHPQPGKATLLFRKIHADELEVACWVQLGYMPEYSILRFDTHGVPLDERRRGWRTCLLQMILKGIITEEQADKEFGEPRGPASTRYRETLYGFRNRGSQWEEN